MCFTRTFCLCSASYPKSRLVQAPDSLLVARIIDMLDHESLARVQLVDANTGLELCRPFTEDSDLVKRVHQHWKTRRETLHRDLHTPLQPSIRFERRDDPQAARCP